MIPAFAPRDPERREDRMHRYVSVVLLLVVVALTAPAVLAIPGTPGVGNSCDFAVWDFYRAQYWYQECMETYECTYQSVWDDDLEIWYDLIECEVTSGTQQCYDRRDTFIKANDNILEQCGFAIHNPA
jgi:hypothetical protein